jgi:hypothetical protein
MAADHKHSVANGGGPVKTAKPLVPLASAATPPAASAPAITAFKDPILPPAAAAAEEEKSAAAVSSEPGAAAADKKKQLSSAAALVVTRIGLCAAVSRCLPKVLWNVVADYAPAVGLASSNILTAAEHDVLSEWLGPAASEAEWPLLYSSRRDGKDATEWHERCDGKGPTITLARVRGSGNVIGGFASTSWATPRERPMRRALACGTRTHSSSAYALVPALTSARPTARRVLRQCACIPAVTAVGRM